MRVIWQDQTGKAKVLQGPADLTTVRGGTVTIQGPIPEASRTSWSLHLGNYVTAGGQVVQRARG